MLKAYIFNAKDHPLHTDMPNSEEYVKCGESTLITTTGRVFSLHHSATISYHFDKIFTPNALEITCFQMMSNCTRMTGHSWRYRLLNVKLTIYFVKFQVLLQKTSNLPHFISTSISVCNAQSFADHLSKSHNLKASPLRAIGVLKGTIIEKWICSTRTYDMQNSE
jgi:hypothetical protein